jgi:O-antigen/teichoic acid export membrane protein
MLHGKLKGYLAGYLPLNLIQAVASLGVVVIYSRLLTPQQYGYFALAMIAIQWMLGFFFYWLHGSVARFYELRRAHDQLSTLLTTTYESALGLSVLLAMATGLTAVFLGPSWRWLVISGLVVLISRALLLVGLEAHRAARNVGRYTVLDGTQSILGLGLGALFVLGTAGGAQAALWGVALACCLVLILDTPSQLPFIRPRAWSNTELRRLVIYGFPLAGSALLNQIVASSDRFFIAWLMDETAVGRYSVAYALADRPSAIVFNWVAMAALPLAFVAMEREGPAAARRVMESTSKSLIFLVLPCTAGLAAVADPLAAVVVGEEFRKETTHLIPWIALASLLYGSMVHFSAHAFQIAEKSRLLMFTYLIVMLLNMVLNLLLIPLFGLDGAVAASIVTYALGFLLQLVLARRFFAVPLMLSHFFRAALACGLMVTIIQVTALPTTPNGLILSILLGIVSYCTSAFILNVADSRSWALAHWRRHSR